MAQINQYLDTIRNATGGEQVRDAIIQALDKIHGDNPVQVTERTATMPSDGSDLEINAEGGIAYDHIVVHPASGSGSGVTKLTELEATENKEYVPDEGEYYSKVTVDVPQLNCDIMEDIYEVTENNTTIYAAEEGFDGFSAIHINVSNVPVSGSFKVRFFGPDKTTVINEQLCPAYGTAVCTALDGTMYQGQTFRGWNPSPTNVTRDLDCYPSYGDIIIDPTEISDGWDVIAAKHGAGYPVGAHKSMYVEVPRQYWNWPNDEEARRNCPTKMKDGKILYPLNIRNSAYGSDRHCVIDVPATGYLIDFIKVAEGESGSTSTWLSKTHTFMNVKEPMSNTWNPSVGTDVESANGAGAWYDPDDDWHTSQPKMRQDWGNCAFRDYLNYYFFNYMPESVKAAIQPVLKTYYGAVNYDDMYPQHVFKQSQDKIWIPSAAEFKSLIQSKTIEASYPVTLSVFTDMLAVEPGIDYTTNYEAIGLNFQDGYRITLRDHNSTFYNTGGHIGSYYLWGSNNGDNISPGSDWLASYFFIGFCL